MTAAEVLEQHMQAEWGERNVARLAREAGYDHAYVSRVMNGRIQRLQPKTAARLAKPFPNLSPDELLRPQAEDASLATVLRRQDLMLARLEVGLQAADGIARLEEALAHVLELLDAPAKARRPGRGGR